MIRRPPRSTLSSSSAASDVYKRQDFQDGEATQRKPGATSRWNRGKDLSWEPLRLELVCEVSYDHLQGTRFRHGTHFQRWRADKAPSDCRYDQLEETAAFEITQIFGGVSSKG